MRQEIKAAVDSLEGLANQLGSLWEPRNLREAWGSWNTPAVHREGLAAIVRRVATALRRTDPQDIPSDVLQALQRIPRQVQFLQQDTAPFIFNGNASAAVPALIATVETITAALEPIIGWEYFPEGKRIPQKLAREVRAMQARVQLAAPEMEQLEQKIQRINEGNRGSRLTTSQP